MACVYAALALADDEVEITVSPRGGGGGGEKRGTGRMGPRARAAARDGSRPQARAHETMQGVDYAPSVEH